MFNKKGYAMWTLDFVAYTGTVLFAVVVLLLLVFGKGDISAKFSSASNVITDDVVLINMLRTPILVDDKNMSLSDLIVLWSFDNDKYKSDLEKNVLSILKSASFQFSDGGSSFVKHYQLFIDDAPFRSSIPLGAEFSAIEAMGVYSYIDNSGDVSVAVPITVNESVYVTLHSYKVGK